VTEVDFLMLILLFVFATDFPPILIILRLILLCIVDYIFCLCVQIGGCLQKRQLFGFLFLTFSFIISFFMFLIILSLILCCFVNLILFSFEHIGTGYCKRKLFD